MSLLRDKGLASAQFTFPATWAVTPEGRLVLAYAAQEGGQ